MSRCARPPSPPMAAASSVAASTAPSSCGKGAKARSPSRQCSSSPCHSERSEESPLAFKPFPACRVSLTRAAERHILPPREGAMDQELVQYLDTRFQSVDRQFQELRGEMNERLEAVKRHTGVLVEGLPHQLQLVAEGLAMHIQVQHVQEREYFDRKFEDTHALIRSSYDHLQQSQDQLRQRVENLERNQQN